MIKHIVFFKLKERSEENVEKAKNVLLGLVGKVPQLKSLEVGIDFNHSERSYDIALVTEFNTKEDLVGYNVHPEHQKVAKYLLTLYESVIVVDYEV